MRLAGLDPGEEEAQGGTSSPTESHESQLDDEILVLRVAGGNREALAVLFRRYARLVRAVAMRILHDSSEADDLLQDVFLFIHRKSGTFDNSKSSARSWIVQRTNHRAIDLRRHLHSR